MSSTKSKEPLEGEYIKRDRSTKYDPSMCKRIIEIAENGGHISQMCQEIGIKSKDTFYRWLKEYPEFKEAYDQSKIASQAFYESVLLRGGLGLIKGFNFNSIAMVMNNKFSEDYKRSSTGSNTEINIGSMTSNTIKSLDEKELIDRIKQLQNQITLDEPSSESDGA